MNSKSLYQVITNMQYTPSMIGAYTRPTGMNMNTINIKQHAHDLVCDYSEFDSGLGQYDITLEQIPDFALHKFASHIMACEPEYAHEANGLDNPAYEKLMLPALVKFLTNTTNKDLEIDFVNAWREGVTSYMHNRMQELLSDALSDYNMEEGC